MNSPAKYHYHLTSLHGLPNILALTAPQDVPEPKYCWSVKFSQPRSGRPPRSIIDGCNDTSSRSIPLCVYGHIYLSRAKNRGKQAAVSPNTRMFQITAQSAQRNRKPAASVTQPTIHHDAEEREQHAEAKHKEKPFTRLTDIALEGSGASHAGNEGEGVPETKSLTSVPKTSATAARAYVNGRPILRTVCIRDPHRRRKVKPSDPNGTIVRNTYPVGLPSNGNLAWSSPRDTKGTSSRSGSRTRRATVFFSRFPFFFNLHDGRRATLL